MSQAKSSTMRRRTATRMALMALCLVVMASLGGREAEAGTVTGGVIAWGNNAFGQSTVPTSAQSGVKAPPIPNNTKNLPYCIDWLRRHGPSAERSRAFFISVEPQNR